MNSWVFNFQSKDVRVVMVEGEPWFVAKDVCEVLGITKNNVSNIVSKLPTDMRGITTLISRTAKGGTPKSIIINEPGLYKIIMRSDKPEAVAFQNWIASDVLPSIRKNGMYMTKEVVQEAAENPSDFLEKAMSYVKEAIGKLEETLMRDEFCPAAYRICV